MEIQVNTVPFNVLCCNTFCLLFIWLSDGSNVATKMWINKSLAWYVYGFWIGYNHYVKMFIFINHFCSCWGTF